MDVAMAAYALASKWEDVELQITAYRFLSTLNTLPLLVDYAVDAPT